LVLYRYAEEAAIKKEREAAKALKGYGGVGVIGGIFDNPDAMKTLEGTVDTTAAADYEDDFM
jgi:hypothetical protein